MSNNELRLSEADYDFGILHPALRRLYADTDLYNYGYWNGADSERIGSLPEAAVRLVQLHIGSDPSAGTASRVLDAGCGLGACTALLAAGYPQALIDGINYSARQIAYAEHRHAGPRVRFHQMDAVKIGFPDESFDCIHAVEAAMHFQPRSSFFSEARRLLKPGGRLIMTDVLTRSKPNFIPDANRLASAEDYARSLEDAGLKPAMLRDIYRDTVVPFTAALRANSMQAYARSIQDAVSGYLLVVAMKVDQASPRSPA